MSDALIEQGTPCTVPGGRRIAGRVALMVVAAMTMGYCTGPAVTIWRILQALQTGDVATLHATIDWPSVRQGLKDDVTEGLLGIPQKTQLASNTLPPFGAGFVSGIAASAIDREVSPEAMLEAARNLGDGSPARGAGWPGILGFGLTSPTSIDVRLRAPGQDAGEQPLHLRFAFDHGTWRVVRVWIPQDLMDRANSGS
ncbi:conserved protein of unknown function [Rhodovastum atsumiense]|nr:DUF2939 domain-containing protein [Rhodovastum atsumiense]CAH2604542.1 conserved protein of unknown function [Rhodovastum atsumiense]